MRHEKFKGHTWESSISKLVMNLVRHSDQQEGETDGAVHWKSMGPKLRNAFQKKGWVHLNICDQIFEWRSRNWKGNWSQASFSSSTDWWQSGKWHEPHQGEVARSTVVGRVLTAVSFQTITSFARILHIHSFFATISRTHSECRPRGR